ncbi:MAG: phosphate signaling complex protein PhoU [Steroidobacteraceae bacterium]
MCKTGENEEILEIMETSDLSHHIHSRYNAELEGVRSGVLQMGGLVEQQLQNGVHAIVAGDSRLGEEVARLDHRVNAMEVAIDEDCSRILATRAPTASDLRLIVAVIKTITDLERIGDETEKLGHAASRLSGADRSADRYRELKHIGELVMEMVHGALDAFARLDTQAALEVARKDRGIDEEYEAIQRQCITFMMEDPRSIRRTLNVLSLARALERVGDHAKNLCEYVVYMVLGKDIRHLSMEDVEKHVRSAGDRS